MNNMVEEASPAHQCIDDVVRGTTARWEELVERLKGTEEELSNVLITWQVKNYSMCVHMYNMYMNV